MYCKIIFEGKQMKRKSGNSIKFLSVLIIIMGIIIVFQAVRISSLKNRLKGLTILDWHENSLQIENGLEFEDQAILITPEFVDNGFQHHSPFNDEHTFAELKEQYLRYGEFDLYGSGRRTGDIRRIHEGVDLYVPENTPVYPIFPVGIVTAVSDDPDFVFQTHGFRGNTRIDSVGVEYGKIVSILYPEGISSLYAHLNEVYVEPGQFVTSDTVVGLTGYTGNIRNSGKPSHLHIELRDEDNESFDPMNRLHYHFASLRKFVVNLKNEGVISTD